MGAEISRVFCQIGLCLFCPVLPVLELLFVLSCPVLLFPGGSRHVQVFICSRCTSADTLTLGDCSALQNCSAQVLTLTEGRHSGCTSPSAPSLPVFPRAGGVGAAAAGTDTLAVSSCIVERRGLLQRASSAESNAKIVLRSLSIVRLIGAESGRACGVVFALSSLSTA